MNAVARSVTLDFYLRLYWRDDRFDMPVFWAKMSNSVRSNGFEITKLIDPNLGKIPFWLPDIRFHDAASIDAIVQVSYHFCPIELPLLNTHCMCSQFVLMQPTLYSGPSMCSLPSCNHTLSFEDYPSDSQTFHLRYGSYAYNQNYLQMQFVEPALTFNQNFDGSYSFLSNPLWEYNAGEYKL